MIATDQHTEEAPQEFAALSSALDVPERTVAEIIGAVASFATNSQPSPIPPAWLAIRACWGVGVTDAARSLSKALLPPDADAVEALDRNNFAPALAWLLHLGVARPVRWQHAPDAITWILDFDKLRRDSASELALVSQQGLQLVLLTMAGVWDATSGNGSLAIKGWPPPCRSRQRTPSIGLTLTEAEDFCRELLARQQARRGWQTTPRILRLR